MPFDPHFGADIHAGYGHEPDTKYPHWLLTLASQDRVYRMFFYIRHRRTPFNWFYVDLYNQNTVPYIPLESQEPVGRSDARKINLYVADIKRLPVEAFQEWVAIQVRQMELRRPLPRKEPAQPASRVQSALRGVRTVFVEGYKKIRRTKQRVRFSFPPEASSSAAAGGPNPASQQIQARGSSSTQADRVNPAPQREKLNEIRVVWPKPRSAAQRANQARQEQEDHDSCCVIVGPSFALSTLITMVQGYRITSVAVLVWCLAIFCSRLWVFCLMRRSPRFVLASTGESLSIYHTNR